MNLQATWLQVTDVLKAPQSDSLPPDSGLHCGETRCRAYTPDHSGGFPLQPLVKELAEAARSYLCSDECKCAPAPARNEGSEHPAQSRSEQQYGVSCPIKV